MGGKIILKCIRTGQDGVNWIHLTLEKDIVGSRAHVLKNSIKFMTSRETSSLSLSRDSSVGIANR